VKFKKDVTNDEIFLWLMHRISEKFRDHALLKGGMALTLFDAPRKTLDLDYVFIPYESKNEIYEKLLSIVHEIEDSKIEVSKNSKAIRIIIRVFNSVVQVEANVALKCKADTISTNSLALKLNTLPRLIKIMSLDVALSHKLAAWNERRLNRDLYDIYFIFKRLGVSPDPYTLEQRLNKINSQLKHLNKIKKMTVSEFKMELLNAVKVMTQLTLSNELESTLTKHELSGLAVKIRSALIELCESIL
jgi:predicted nucleotidyltransferase component of viral defense system